MAPELYGQAKAFLNKALPEARVGVVGDLAVDRFVFGSVDRISPEAPVPVLVAENVQDRLGCAANVARGLAALREPFRLQCEVIGAVGADADGEALVKSLQELGRGIHVRVLRDSSRPTTLKTRFLAGSQQQLLRVDRESTSQLSAELDQGLREHVKAALPGLKTLIVQDYAKGLFSEAFLSWLFQEARAAGVLTIVDPNPRTPGRFYRGAGLLTPNVAEAEALLGRSLGKGRDNEVVAEACRELKNKYALDKVLITRSAHGMTLLDEGFQAHHFPSIARAVYDVTGAGDTVVATLGAAYASGASLPVACTLATVAASIVVGKVGTATATVDELRAELP
jgi:D-beta-D-heptose 7-phosphate kinase/D-beta-D-heptose 1-phosphate adenosyltransferase